MDDDRPGFDVGSMPSFIRSFEEERANVSPNVQTDSSSASVGVLKLHASRSESRLSLQSEPPVKRSGEPKEDAEGNNNNNCNGGGRQRQRRTVSALELLRRNFRDSTSPPARVNTVRRMQSVNSDGSGSCSGRGWDQCKKSELATGDPGPKNEPTLSDIACPRVHEVEHVTSPDYHSKNTLEEPFPVKEHIYCSVYCIAADNTHKDSHYHNETTTEVDLGEGSNPEASLYTLDDLVDPFADRPQKLYTEQAEAEPEPRTCRVCLETSTLAALPCCSKSVCEECMKLYVSSQVTVGKVHIPCPITECSGSLEEGLVTSHLANRELAMYQYFLELNQLDSSTKPCPQCHHFTTLKAQNPRSSEHKYKIQCSNCQFVWCFKCHAPWHNGIKCREYRKGDKLLRTWASVIEHGQRNAQKCPQCKIHIQRTEGCDHMTCTQCNTNFCYMCGERYRHLRFFGDHTSDLSVFGCKYGYLPDKPHLRRLVRGSVCATKVLLAPVVILLVLVLGALALVIGLVAFPVYYMCKKRKKQQQHTRGSWRWI
ncbi:E3 ubiquitin-protein ligase RNF217 isoform X1 [Gouania willdenowi]|uniref:RBR-type E3 ubiquitin transferase n=1 Tax=Gouania willdenowi TaxID=441366 RepID=A0A8C5HSB6_GOUWI|nr:probable E3 ubiquitin-protein ligase RNF217 isoform X1 [Gouania willdenowi]